MKQTLYYFFTLALILWAQMALNFFFGSSGFSMNVILVATLYFGLARGPLSAELLGFFWGLLIDASSLGLLGQQAVLYAGAGFLAGILRRKLDNDKVWTQTIFSFGVSILYVILSFILDRLFSANPHALSWSVVAQPFINAILAPLLFLLLGLWSELWDLRPIEA